MSATPEVVKPSARKLAVRVFKLVISALYFALDRARNQWQRWQRQSRSGTCVVLYYHAVPAAYRNRFEQQMNILVKRGGAIEIGKLNSLPDNRHAIAITFDDGLESFAENAAPVLERLNLPATVFAVTDAMGGQPMWGESYFATDERVMSAETLRRLPANISVGSHTLTHRDLVTLTADDAAREIGESRQRLETMLGRPVTLFSFPFGAFDDATVRQCFEAGYDRVFTTEPELIPADTDAFVMGRVAADPWDWRLEFRLKIAGAYCWQPWARKLRDQIPHDSGPRKSETNPWRRGPEPPRFPRGL